MADHQDKMSGAGKARENSDKRRPENKDDIIELSDMAVGISPEDEPIINLTEDLVDEAIAGFSGASGRMEVGDELLDLSEKRGAANDPEMPASASPVGDSEAGEFSGADSIEAIEADIARELDNYFQLEEETQELLNEPAAEPSAEPENPPASDAPAEPRMKVTPDQFEAALERVIRKMFGEKIDRILEEVIERTVSDEVGDLKQYLLKRTENRE